MDEKTLLTRIREFFGMTAGELRNEWKTLTDKDKNDFVDMFNKAGMPTTRMNKA